MSTAFHGFWRLGFWSNRVRALPSSANVIIDPLESRLLMSGGAAGAVRQGPAVRLAVTDDVPVAPSAPFLSPVSPTQIRLNWFDRSTNEQGFIVERSQDYGRRYTRAAVLGPDSTSYTDGAVIV